MTPKRRWKDEVIQDALTLVGIAVVTAFMAWCVLAMHADWSRIQDSYPPTECSPGRRKPQTRSWRAQTAWPKPSTVSSYPPTT